MGLLGIYLNEILFGYSSWNVAESVSMKMKFFVIINVDSLDSSFWKVRGVSF